jgi:hypothetical protein
MVIVSSELLFLLTFKDLSVKFSSFLVKAVQLVIGVLFVGCKLKKPRFHDEVKTKEELAEMVINNK